MSFERELDFKVGNGFFRKLWVTAPASTRVSDGLGPLFNARSCQSCHLKDGRGHPPTGPDDPAVGMFLRLSVPADAADRRCRPPPIEDYLATLPEPHLWRAAAELRGAGAAGRGADGDRLRGGAGDARRRRGGDRCGGRATAWRIRPTGRSTRGGDDLAAGGAADDRARAARGGAGGGHPGAGRSRGRATATGSAGGRTGSGRRRPARPMLGRFGLKAGQPTIRDQAASAFVGDIGISTSAASGRRRRLHRGAAALPGAAGRRRAGGRRPGARPRDLLQPQPGGAGAARSGRPRRCWRASGCSTRRAARPATSPKFVTDRLEDQPEQSFQLIWPYTDLLLHDMGEGLADHRPEARGQRERVADGAALGHRADRDGHRAGELPARRAGADAARGGALAWRRGAGGARHASSALPKAERDALIRFLESL